MARKLHATLACVTPLIFCACLLILCLAVDAMPAQGDDHHVGTLEGNGCLVLQNQDLTPPFKDSVLGFITPKESLQLVLTSSAYNKDQHRDVVLVSNSAATLTKVRGGNPDWPKRNPYPVLIPEGWITLNLTVEEENIKLSWVTGKGEAPLVSLIMDYPADNIFLIGIFSVCSEGAPEWEVSDGQEADVTLDLQNNEQQLDVIGNVNDTAYLKTSTGDEFNVTANTTLILDTTRLDLSSKVKVLFKGYEETKDVIEELPRSRPMVKVGGRHGSTRLRLKRASQPSPSVSPSPYPFQTITIVLAILLAAASIGLVYLLVTRKPKESTVPEVEMTCKLCKTKIQSSKEDPTEEAEKTSPLIYKPLTSLAAKSKYNQVGSTRRKAELLMTSVVSHSVSI